MTLEVPWTLSLERKCVLDVEEREGDGSLYVLAHTLTL